MEDHFKLGVCYYPEHWLRSEWEKDARLMKQVGLKQVRMGEFAWSRFEPQPNKYDWSWFDEAIEVLSKHDLEIALCTPTATPPRWLIEEHPEILPVAESGQVRQFGARRHYCFSSRVYRRECAKIVEAMAHRYGNHPSVTMWQTDNEYGHHGTDQSYSSDAIIEFQHWLENRYENVETLNCAWGTVFWSQEYSCFSQILPPMNTVTEANPSQALDWRRFCSDQICSFNWQQAEIIRKLSPGRQITHNFIGDFTSFDHQNLCRSLDIASWDSYPIGFLSEGDKSRSEKNRWLRFGDPDFAGFNHDVFRACAPKWAVMEQQPGPVNWAKYNAAPAPGMVRVWTWEAFAHGAHFVSFFRWRQVPFAQEQMHAGLLAVDGQLQPVLDEIGQFSRECQNVSPLENEPADIAILLDYPSLWQSEIQKQGNYSGPLMTVRQVYSACRQNGLNVDFIFSNSDFDDYKLIILPSTTIIDEQFALRLAKSNATVLATPLTGARTIHGHLPINSPPGLLADAFGVQVRQLETLAPHLQTLIVCEGREFAAGMWRERIETTAQIIARFTTGEPAWTRNDHFHYLASWPSAELLEYVVETLCDQAGLQTLKTGRDLRLRRAGKIQFAFNYGSETIDLIAKGCALINSNFLIGERHIKPANVAAWLIAESEQ